MNTVEKLTDPKASLGFRGKGNQRDNQTLRIPKDQKRFNQKLFISGHIISRKMDFREIQK